MMLAYAEPAGIYVDTAGRKVWVMDQVDAQLTDNGDLKIKKTTGHDVPVKVLQEDAESRVMPLHTVTSNSWRTVVVPAGSEAVLRAN